MPWRDLPERFGPWKSVYNRFNNWAKKGHWEVIFKELQLEVDEVGSIVDGSAVRAHQDASGGKGGPKQCPRPFSRRLFDQTPRRRRYERPAHLHHHHAGAAARDDQGRRAPRATKPRDVISSSSASARASPGRASAIQASSGATGSHGFPASSSPADRWIPR